LHGRGDDGQEPFVRVEMEVAVPIEPGEAEVGAEEEDEEQEEEGERFPGERPARGGDGRGLSRPVLGVGLRSICCAVFSLSSSIN
jgi:hypothetical protein